MLHISNVLKSYLFIGFILLLMVGVSLHYIANERKINIENIGKTISDNEHHEQRAMDTTIILMILSTIGIIATVYRNPQWEKLRALINNHHKENRTEHEQIVGVLKKLQFKYDLETSLQETVDDVLEITSGELSDFINDEGNMFKDFAKDVSNGGLYASSAAAIAHKAKMLSIESDKRALQVGDEFVKLHKKSQEHHVKVFVKGVEEVLMDEFFNSKQKRFRLFCEQFLHNHLTDSVRNYMKVKK